MTSCYNVYPRTDFGRLQREVDRVFGHAADAARPILGTSRIGEDENNHYIELDAPGLNPKTLNISFQNQELTVHAEYSAPNSDENSTPIQWRSGTPRTGEFNQRFKLPETIDSDEIHAAYNHGVLRISVPKSETNKPRQVSVEVS